jgi:putative ABC transport system permease protein
MSNQRKDPPKLVEQLLELFTQNNDEFDFSGTLRDLYNHKYEKDGKLKADLWFWKQVLCSIFKHNFSSLSWGIHMFKNYLKIALRNIKRHKSYSSINIIGLSIGLACCILIFLWINDELSYDRFHPNANRIYRVITVDHSGGKTNFIGESPSLVGPTLVAEYPEVMNYTRVQSGWKGSYYLHHGEKNFYNERLANADPSFFEVFHFPFIKGDPKTALHDRYSIVLTEELAQKCFGNEDPMNEVMLIDDEELTVTGVIKAIPSNSHIQFDYIVPIENFKYWRSSELDSWTYSQYTTYIELREGADSEAFSRKISGLVKKHHPESPVEIYLQPLTDVHLHSNHIRSWTTVYSPAGNITYVTIFALTAVCILLIACINYMNLSTARSGLRGKEVGMRKVVGARRMDIAHQFLGEGVLLSCMAFFVSLPIVCLLLPTFNSLAGKSISMNFLGNCGILLGLLCITAVTGVISGSYPAFFLSSLKPVKILKSNVILGSPGGGILRKCLVVGQFTFTVVLILFSLVVYRQLHFIQNRDLGFDRDAIIYYPGSYDYATHFDAAKNELLQNPNILDVCNGYPPGQEIHPTSDVSWEGKDPNSEVTFDSKMGDYNYFEFFGMELVEGRFHSREFSDDPSNFVINESAARLIGSGSVVGKRLTLQGRTGTIIGVMKDHHEASLHSPILPQVFKLQEWAYYFVRFQRNAGDMVQFLENHFEKFEKIRPFRYHFLDAVLNGLYKTERWTGNIFRLFTGLAIFIACLGLFGLASFTAEQRTKEIGIRKVLGASVGEILILFSRKFIIWVVVANIIAWPIAYFIMTRWLQNFAYRINVGIWMFILSIAIVFIITFFTVTYQSIRAAIADPIEALRYE